VTPLYRIFNLSTLQSLLSSPPPLQPNKRPQKHDMPPVHLISKVGDPLFALFIGLSAAGTRINREEKEQGRTTEHTINAGLRRLGIHRGAGETGKTQQ